MSSQSLHSLLITRLFSSGRQFVSRFAQGHVPGTKAPPLRLNKDYKRLKKKRSMAEDGQRLPWCASWSLKVPGSCFAWAVVMQGAQECSHCKGGRGIALLTRQRQAGPLMIEDSPCANITQAPPAAAPLRVSPTHSHTP